MLQPGDVLQQRYRIVAALKRGGMGAVYEAHDERLDSRVALKETLFDDPALRRQFEREARLLARLRHPGLVRVIDHFTEGSGQFLVMDLVDGQDLAEILEKRGAPLHVPVVLPWMTRLLDVLAYLHAQDPPVIHRDIKPANLKLTARGDVILLDFGLAKGKAGPGASTVAASFYGFTPCFAPPEQVLGTGTDARSDLYSVAATMYCLLTATTPPDALTRSAASINGHPDPLRSAQDVNPELPAAVARFISGAMSLRADDRPASAAGMRAQLSGAVAQAAVTAPGGYMPESTWINPRVAPASPQPAVQMPVPVEAVPVDVSEPPAEPAWAIDDHAGEPAPAPQADPLKRTKRKPRRVRTHADPISVESPEQPKSTPVLAIVIVAAVIVGIGLVVGGALDHYMSNSTPTAPLPPPPPVRVGEVENVKPPVKMKNVDPIYPALAQSDRVQGVVIVEAIIGPTGKVTDARVMRSIPLLDDAALDAVRQWEYEPTFLKGVPVTVIMKVGVNFTLQERQR